MVEIKLRGREGKEGEKREVGRESMGFVIKHCRSKSWFFSP